MVTKSLIVKQLEQVPLFKGLSRRHLGRIASAGAVKRVPRLTRLTRQGEAGDTFYVLLEGTANVRRARGKPIVLQPGESFGELALLGDAPRAATVEAAEEAVVLELGRPAFQRMLREQPTVSIALLRNLAKMVNADRP
jgi:CRP-like cAMP-binding protein